MNMKKIISAICALSMAVTSFAAMAVTANAEGEARLWSDTFNGYDNVQTAENFTYNVLPTLVNGQPGGGMQYSAIEGIVLATCGRGSGDDSSYFVINAKEDDATDKYLTTTVSRFSNQGRGSSITFNETYTAEAGKDVVLAMKLKLDDPTAEGGCTYLPAFKIGNTVLSKTGLGMESGVWTDVKVVITTTGTTVYVNDEAKSTSTDTSLSGISFSAIDESGMQVSGESRASTNPHGYPFISLDDMVVYTSADGAASTVPDAETKGDAEVTYANAPQSIIPDGMNVFANLNFDNETAQRYTFVNDGLTDGYTAIKGITLKAGQDGGDTRSETKWESVGNNNSDPEYGTDIYLKAYNSTSSTANRGPQLIINKEVAERETVGVSFATRLHAGDNGPAEVIFSGDLVASASKGNLASPLAMITTDATAASGVYACDNPLTKVEDGGTNVLQVADNEWVVVTIKATRPASKTVNASIAVTTGVGTEEEATTYILGSADEMVTIQDSSRSGVTNLPYITFRSGNDTDYGVSGSSNDIDNLVIYTDGDATMPKDPDTTITDMTISADGLSVTSPTAASETAVVIKATPKDDGTFSVEIFKGLEMGENDLTWTNAPVAGDKIMVFNGFQSIMPAAAAPVVIAEVEAAPAE